MSDDTPKLIYVPGQPILQKEDWIFLLGIGLTFILAIRGCGAEVLGVFSALVLGHNVTAKTTAKFLDKNNDGKPDLL